jgi:hypothetical protein
LVNGLKPRQRIGKLLILRFTPLGLRRLRLDTTSSSKISSSTFLWNTTLSTGGKGLKDREFPTYNTHCMDKRESVRIFVRFECRLMHQTSDGEMSHHEAIKLLTDKLWCLDTKDNSCSSQMGFQLIQSCFDLPAFMVESSQLSCGSVLILS